MSIKQISVFLENKPNALQAMCETLAEGHIDIEYMYSLFTHQEGKAYMVFRISDEEKFVKLLSENGMHIATKEELELK